MVNMRNLVTLAVPLAATGVAHAGGLELSIEIPKLNVAEYHRPYVAIWIEDANGKVATNLSVWYDVALKDREGEKWLKDIRQWWRRTGRELTLPVDGVSGPTRPPGVAKVNYGADNKALQALQPGDYKLVIEASREVGGRELVEIPFQWAAGAEAEHAAAGKSELGAVRLKIVK